MSIDHVLAVVPVTDIERSHEWYVRLLGREPDNHPMPTLIEWQVVDRGWVQVTRDATRAGSALLNLAVDDLSSHVAQLAGPGPRARGDRVGEQGRPAVLDRRSGPQPGHADRRIP